MVVGKILLTVVTGLVLFMFGIENFSREIQQIAGDRFRSLLRLFTRNRVSGTILGAVITAILQSSTATTVITISLVSSGLMSFVQSLGIILGANIGTTVTAQLVALKVTSFAPYFIIIGFLISVFSKKYSYVGKGLFYFGMVFFGLTLVSDAIGPIKADPMVIDFFANLSNMYIALAAGLIFTAIVQSSSVTTGIVVVLAANGLVSLSQAIPILLGANIGTTVTTLIASVSLNLYAKRAAVAHAFFNVLGVLLILPFISPFVSAVAGFGGTTAQQIANAHTLFNILAAVVFLFILNPFKRLVDYIVPGKEKEILLRPKYLGKKLPKSNSKAFKLIEKELSYGFDIIYLMFEKSIAYLRKPKTSELDKIRKLETLSDLLDDKIESSLLELSKREHSESDAKRIVVLVRLSNAIEQLGDIGQDLDMLPVQLCSSDSLISEKSWKKIFNVYNVFKKAIILQKKSFPYRAQMRAKKMTERDGVEKLISHNYMGHVELLKGEHPYSGSSFVESISLLESAISKLREVVVLTREYEKLCKK